MTDKQKYIKELENIIKQMREDKLDDDLYISICIDAIAYEVDRLVCELKGSDTQHIHENLHHV